MNNITKDRVKLIRSIQSALQADFSDPAKNIIKEIITTIREDNNNHYLSISQEVNGKVSYAQSLNHKFDNRQRVRTTFRRYVRRQLKISPESFSDKSLFELGRIVAGKTVSHDDLDSRIELLEGDDIVEHYRNTSTESCMTNDNSWKVQLYADNPDRVKLVVLDDYVRALLWTCDNGTIALDRIYPCGCDAVALLQSWATKNGYVFRKTEGFCPGSVNFSDNKIQYVTVNHSGTYPYMDTFAYAEDNGNGTITISNKWSFGDFELTNTDGGHSHLYHCSCCNRSLSEDDRYTAFDETYCQDCFYESFFYCSHCGYEAVLDDRVTVGDESYCPECVKKLFKECEDCNEYFNKDDLTKVILTDGESQMVCDECLDEYTCCANCDEYFETSEMEEINGDEYCSACAESIDHDEEVRDEVHTKEIIAA